MADVRCPMCGKPNPADREDCQYCQARLKPLRAGDNEPASRSDAGSTGGQDSGLPDWLQALGAADSSEPAHLETSGPENDDNDWLKNLMGEAGEYQDSGPDSNRIGSYEEDEGADWLSRISGEPASPVGLPSAPASTSEPDWPQGPAEEEAEEAPAAFIEAGLPDWLAGEETPSDAGAAAGKLDWLKTSGEQEIGAEMYTPATNEGTPDWLKPVEPQAAASGIPEWMREDRPAAASPATEAGEQAGIESGTAGTSEAPDWLLDLTGPQAGDASSARPSDEPEWLSGESLDWLASEMHAGAGDETTRGTPPFSSAGLESDLSWLEEMDVTAPGAAPSFEREGAEFALPEEDQPAFTHDKALPSWLHENEGEPSEGAAGGEGDAGLKPAELPGWLQAMRPVGVVGLAAPGEDGLLLGAGPLAGLRGALPAEPDISQIDRPPVYSSRLDVSDLHQAHVELLQGLIASEGQLRPIPSKPALTSLSVLRISAAALLILSILLSMLTGFPQNGLPLYTAEVSAAVQLINRLPAGAPVLLAVDYEPGMSAEMDALTGAVLEHLINKGAYIAVVSTIPTGPVQAEHLASQARSKGLTFDTPQNYANLGFIPGGASGLLGFSQAPQRIAPADLRGQRVWGGTPLQGVARLEDFRLLVFATENPDTARAWVEQVGTQLNETVPMVALVSAQADPMVRPYADARQLQGLVSGLMGGAAYEGAAQQVGAAIGFWSPFSFGMLVSGLLAGVVIFFNLFSARLSRREQNAGSGARGERTA